MRLVILGGTGSGKGTQTAQISHNLAIPSISIGEILRTGINAGSDLGIKAKSYVEKGELVPDELMIQFVKRRLLESDVTQGWILEGYPRTAFQAEELDFLLKQLKQKLDGAIYLKVSESVAIERALNRGLEDDSLDIIQRRLQSFQKFTVPILEYYQYCHRLLTIDGENNSQAVTQEIISQLKSRSSY